MLKNWTNLFIYHIKNNKLFTFLNVLGLSIGIAGLIFAILYWNEEHSYDEWNSEKEKVYQVQTNLGGGTVWPHSVAGIEPYLKSNFSEVEAYFYTDNWYEPAVVKFEDKKEIVDKLLSVQPNFFDFFPLKFKYGSPKNGLNDEENIVISDVVSQRIFGTINPVGKSIILDNKAVTVRGVYELNVNSSLAPEIVINRMDGQMRDNKNEWGNFNYSLYLKVKNPSNIDKIASKIQNIYYDNRERTWGEKEGKSSAEIEKTIKESGIKIILEPLTSARLHSKIDGYPEGKGDFQFLLIMVVLSVLILILSIVNYINLATANAIKRAKEVGVRKILGASKSNIIKQFLFETVLTVLFSIILSLVIVELSLPYYNEFLDKNLVMFGSQFYAALSLIFIITVILAGFFPALYVSNFETLKVLKGNFSRSKSGIWLRNGMLILQFAIASFFIIGSYIVYEQVNFLANKEVGFKGSQVLSIEMNNEVIKAKNDVIESFDGVKAIYQKYELIKQEVSKVKGVQGVNSGTFDFGNNSNSSSQFTYNGVDIQAQNMAVDLGMLEMMQIKIVQGRSFSSKFASDTISSMMVNETAMRMMNEKNPIGKEVNWNDKKLTIIGVVSDFNLYSPQSKVPPMAFFHLKTIGWLSYNMNKIYVKVDGENMEQTIAGIEQFWQENSDSDYPFSYDFVDKKYARTYQMYVNQKNLFSLLNFIVILIALFGLFALASYSIQRRMKEIAIRKTLGAETNVLLISLSKQYVVFCVIGFLIAVFPAYYLLNQWLENFASRIEISILPFIIGFFVLLLLTLVVVLTRAYQATKVDVLKYLKYE
ncbi:ABC transporter permease [Flavobacterium tegetincola]|uniref:ABC transporter permease n=1 Tax=Flavobacterium tegetincola TaxID=150172 RepID=UPI0004189A45|nr:ABC transporter permease [Flavobacterium tegetincola]